MSDDTAKTPKPRRRKGEGTIYWDAEKGCYRGEISLGTFPSGKRNRPTVYGPTEKAVLDQFKTLREAADNGVQAAAKYTVKEALNDWFTRGTKGLDADTVKMYRSYADNHLIPELGKAKLRLLTADHVDDFLESKRTALSTRSLQICRSVLRRAINLAQRRNRVLRNVAELVSVPTGRPGRPSKAMTMAQAEAVMAASQGWIHVYLVVSLMTGVRTEEARALRWQHVHLDEVGEIPPHVEVWRSVRKTGDTKTAKSRRTLALPTPVVGVLENHRDEQRRTWKERGQTWRESGLVFSTRNETQLSAGNVRRALRSVLKAAGLPREWTPRELRHSFVSLMSANGAPVELIARLVGHAKTSTTELVYRKELRPVITEGADLMGEVFKPR